MRTNIEIDDELMAKAMSAGPYQTKKDAVEAGLKLLARQATYREILKWEGKLRWEGDESIDWTQPDPREPAQRSPALMVAEPVTQYLVQRPTQAEKRSGTADAGQAVLKPAQNAAAPAAAAKRRAGR